MDSDTLRAIPYLVKLVRDGLAEKLAGDTITYEPIKDKFTACEMLRAKLVEEATEYLLDPSVHELADVVEVCRALAYHDLAARWDDVEAERLRKLESRGGFQGLTGMWAQTSAGKWV